MNSVNAVVSDAVIQLQQTGRMAGARWCPSPNYGQRPDRAGISLLIVHNISLPPGQYGGPAIEQFFCNNLDPNEHPYFETIAGMTVSSHMLIRRDGGCVQFVSFLDRAWHAGRSSFEGRVECNDFAIGIELEGTDTDPYTAEQYQSLAEVTCQLMQAWPDITRNRITGHSDVAPGRKTDPGPAFDWTRFGQILESPQNAGPDDGVQE